MVLAPGRPDLSRSIHVSFRCDSLKASAYGLQIDTIHLMHPH